LASGGTMQRAGLRAVCALIISVIAASGAIFAPLPASAASYGPGSLVSDVPVNGTPHVLDGRVNSIVQVGNTIILGGQFTQTRNNSSETVIARANLVAFDATTKEISTTFAPNPNGTVNVVLPTGDGETVFVGGSFTTIGGLTRKNLVKVRVSDGSVVPEFNAGTVAGQVKDLRLSNGRLWVAGGFTHIANAAQLGLATLNPTTGALNQYMRRVIAGLHDGGFTTVMKIDINAQGTRLVAIGNFDTIDGMKNHQLFVLDLTGAIAAVSSFHTTFYEATCSSSFDSYMRDLDFSPDGSFFVVSTTGAYGGAGSACDSTARFEIDAGATATPSWVNNTGGDTTYALEITDSVVYTGGHARWQNNPFRADQPGQGAVSRPGVAALDPLNGLPLSWNPTRDRGVGVFDFLFTEQGLWVGSDTTRIGADYLRSRIALLPVGGDQFPGVRTPTLPNDVYAVRAGGIDRRSYNGSAFTPAQAAPGGGMTTNNIRGSFMLNGNLYIAWSDGTFDRRSFDGTTYGTPVAVDTASELTAFTNWTTDVASMTGLFYDSGRLYFTRSGQSSLFYRYFTPESDVVGAQRLTASSNTVPGIDFTQVRGMFLAGDKLYWSLTSGELRRIDWVQGAQSGKPVAGTHAVVSGPALDGNDWGSPRALFLFQDPDGDGPPATPVAAFSSDCLSLDCTFDSSASSVEGATITSRTWTFGDGETGTGTAPEHTYAASGTHDVTLTVTSSKGKTASVTHPVQVTRINQEPTAAFTFSCDQLECSFDGSSSDDPGGDVTDYAWDFGDGDTGSGSAVDHTYTSAGSRTVTLTVTDNDGGTDTKSNEVTTTLASVAYVGSASTNGNRTTHSVTTPSGVQAGDTLLLFLTTNSSAATITASTGWSQVRAGSVDGLQARVWSKTATAADAGAGVSVLTSTTIKSDLTVAAYRADDMGSGAVSASALSFSSSAATQLTTPQVDVTTTAAWLVSYWGAKSSSAVTLTTPASEELRSGSTGTGSGNITAALADSDGPVAHGARGGLTTTASATTSRGAMVSVVIAPE
jgi:PKD repeat protein